MSKKEKSNLKNINLKVWIPVAVVALVIIISLVLLLSSKTRVAFLNIEEGQVEVDTGKGWMAASDGMDLSEDDKVRTLSGKAVLVLFESVIVEMQENTEVIISDLSKKHLKLNQASGSTWNKFASIVGINNFEIETPTTVATVRGTEFWVDMDSVGVAEGKVDVKWADKLLKLSAGQKALLENGNPVIKKLTEQEIRERVLRHKQMIVDSLRKLRQMEIEKHSFIYSMVKKTRGWTDQDVAQKLERLDNGEYDAQELKNKAKIPAASIERFTKITEEILKVKQQMREIEQNLLGGQRQMPIDPLGSQAKEPAEMEQDPTGQKEMPPDPLGYEAEDMTEHQQQVMDNMMALTKTQDDSVKIVAR